MPDKISVELGNVQKTLLLPLWGRAVEAQKKKPLLMDKTAVDIVGKIDYDFSKIESGISAISRIGWIVRSLLMDRCILSFLERYPRGTIVNIGCGFDTTFDRIDNGKLLWYDLDLPDVMQMRKNFIKENDRRKFIAESFLEHKWLERLEVPENILFMAAGVLYYFEEHQIRSFFEKAADLFPNSEIVFDATSPTGLKVANKTVIKSSGLNKNSFLKWGLQSAKKLKAWDKRIEIMEESVFFKDLKGKYDIKTKITAFMSDALKMQYLVHLKL